MDDHAAILELDEYKRLPEKAQRIVRHFKMQKIPHEGPWFLETFRSTDVIEGPLAERYSGPRIAYTGIYALATRESFSALHRLRTDEMWHFYGGDPAELLLLKADGTGEVILMGTDVLEGHHQQFLVPAETWMAARPVDGGDEGYSFIGNTLSPGFEFADYDAGYREELETQYPDFRKEIADFTRDDSITRPPTDEVVRPSSIVLTEMVGRTSEMREENVSIARLSMDAGTSSPSSYLKTGNEYLIVNSGRGHLHIGETSRDLQTRDIVRLPPNTPHQILAHTGMELLLVCRPAYDPENHVVLNEQS